MVFIDDVFSGSSNSACALIRPESTHPAGSKPFQESTADASMSADIHANLCSHYCAWLPQVVRQGHHTWWSHKSMGQRNPSTCQHHVFSTVTPRCLIPGMYGILHTFVSFEWLAGAVETDAEAVKTDASLTCQKLDHGQLLQMAGRQATKAGTEQKHHSPFRPANNHSGCPPPPALRQEKEPMGVWKQVVGKTKPA